MLKPSNVIIFTLLYIIGIITFLSNAIIPVSLIILCVCAFYKTLKTKFVILLLIAFSIGIFNTALNIKYDDNLSSYSDNFISVSAKVMTIPTNNIKGRTKFYAQVQNAVFENEEIKTHKDKILVTINDDISKISNIKIGDSIELYGRLKLPKRAQNPSQFDYSKYLMYKKTFSLLYVENKWEIKSRANDFTGKFLSKLNDTREKILKIHAKNIKSPMLEILGGIIFGDDAVNPDEETKESFINSGIFHILAASGMNVTLIFGIWFFVAMRFKLNYHFSIISGMLLVVFYTFMTGFGPPIIRAALMLLLILIGKLINRKTKTLDLLFLVGFLMILYNPLMLFDVGFQLSFIVTFALILTAPIVKFKNNALNTIVGACFIPFIAQIYAAPLQMYYFNTFTLYSLFANIAIIPVLSIVSFVGFISSMIALIGAISDKICYIADIILNPFLVYIVKTAEFFSDLPYSIIILKKPLLLQVILYYVIVISVTLIITYKKFNKQTLLVLLGIVLIFTISFIHIPNKNAELIYFSVENADSFLIKTPSSDYFMIDTGKIGFKGANTPAKNIMIKYLRDKGINTLNGLILSHFDSDHAGGSIDILKDINVKKLFITDVYEDTKLSEDIKNYVKDNNIEQEIITENKEIYNKNGFKMTLLKPKSDLIKTENQKSLIVHFNYKGKNFLFMGDGDINTYNALENKFKENTDVMKSGHHGAKGTVNEEMVKNSDLFIISTGYNIYNHPHPQTLEMITKNGKKYLRTDYNNAIRIIVDDKEIKIQNYSPKYKRFMNVNRNTSKIFSGTCV